MRKTLFVVPVLLSLLGLALPALGETPPTPAAPAGLAVNLCPAPAASAPLPELLPQPFFKTDLCGSCSDPGCPNNPLGTSCSVSGFSGHCSGIAPGGQPQHCPDSRVYCTCLTDL